MEPDGAFFLTGHTVTFDDVPVSSVSAYAFGAGAAFFAAGGAAFLASGAGAASFLGAAFGAGAASFFAAGGAGAGAFSSYGGGAGASSTFEPPAEGLSAGAEPPLQSFGAGLQQAGAGLQQLFPPSDGSFGRLSFGNLKIENSPPLEHLGAGLQHFGAGLQAGAALQHFEELEFPKKRKPAWAWAPDSANAASAAQIVAVRRIRILLESKSANLNGRLAHTKCFAATRNANTASRGFRLAEPPPASGVAWLLKIPILTVKLTAQSKMTKVSTRHTKSTVQRKLEGTAGHTRHCFAAGRRKVAGRT
jgi:hypothetical protein